MDCESWEFEKRHSDWVLCPSVRTRLEMMYDRFGGCHCQLDQIHFAVARSIHGLKNVTRR